MHIRKAFYIWLFLIPLLISRTPTGATATKSSNASDNQINVRKIVKIKIQSQKDINELASIVEPWEVHKDYIIVDVTEKVMQQIMDKGFSVEVLFESTEELLTIYGRPLPQAGPEGLYHSYE